MGLIEKKAIRDFTEGDFARYVGVMTTNGIKPQINVLWDSLPPVGTGAIEKAGYAVREFRDVMLKMSKDSMVLGELNSQIDTVTIKHDESMKDEYTYTLVKNGKEFAFTANLNILSWNPAKQKPLQTAMMELL